MAAVSVSWIDYGVLSAYLALMIGVGYYVYRQSPNFEEYLLGGRMMTTPILVCTLASTYYGLDILFGTTELAFNEGVVAFFGYSELSLLIYVFAAFAIAKRLREANFTTLPEILERNYGRSAALVGAFASIFYAVPSTSLFALGRICEAIFGIPAPIGAAALGGIALVYTLLGGLWAVAITDTIQFVLMCVTLAVAIPMLMAEVGGFDAVAVSAPEGYFSILGGTPIWLMIAYAAMGLSILVDPAYYHRIFAAKNYRQARNAMLIAIVVWTAYDWVATAGGMLAFEAAQAGLIPADIHTNDAFLVAVFTVLPAGLAALFLSGVLATAMSTIDSYTLVAGANMSYDLYRPLVNKKATSDELVRVTKWGVVVSWLIGYVLAFMFTKILALLVFVTTILTSTVLVPIFMGLFWKGTKKPLAGTLSCASGLITVVVYYLLIRELGVFNEVYGTYVWSFSIGNEPYALWQEYALYFSLPASLLGFIVGNVIGHKSEKLMAQEAGE